MPHPALAPTLPLSSGAQAQTAKLPIGPLIAATVKKYLEDLAMGLTNTFLVFLFVIYLLERPRKTSIIKGTYAEQIEKRIKQYLLTKVRARPKDAPRAPPGGARAATSRGRELTCARTGAFPTRPC